MTTEPGSNNGDIPAEKSADTSTIQPASFTPASDQRVQTTPIAKIKIIGAVLLVATLLCVGFLLTAKTIIIELQPTSTFELTGRFFVRFGDHILIRPGTVSLHAEKQGYKPLRKDLVINKEAEQKFLLAFEKMPGSLKLITEPKVIGEVFLNDQSFGTNEKIITDIPAGSQTLRFKSKRYLEVTKTIDVAGMNQQQDLTLNLTPAWAEITINSNPAGAEVLIDGKSVATTPASIEILQGDREISIKKDNFQSWQGQFSFVAGDTLELPAIKLSKLAGRVTIASQPSDAGVTINNVYRGQTPLQLDLPEGQQRIELFKEGYKNALRVINLGKHSSRDLSLKLDPALGAITISATPSSALIYIDERLMGRAGKQLTLPAKDYRLRVESDGYVSQEKTISVRAGKNGQINLTLLTEEAHAWQAIPDTLNTEAGPFKLFKVNQTFTMGASRREQGRRANESQRKIKLDRAFYLGRYEISNKQYRLFNRMHSSSHSKSVSLNLDPQPVVNISWQDAARYCNWLSEREGLAPAYQFEEGKYIGSDLSGIGYRLPTEAEWAWAARFDSKKGAGTASMKKYPWGHQLPPAANSGNYADRSGASQLGRIQADYNDGHPVSAPIGQFTANDKGLFDLGGNVAEWIHDYYGIASGLSRKLEINPAGPKTGDHHVIRGSSWRHGSRADLRLSFRDYGQKSRSDLGFRIARYARILETKDQAQQP